MHGLGGHAKGRLTVWLLQLLGWRAVGHDGWTSLLVGHAYSNEWVIWDLRMASW